MELRHLRYFVAVAEALNFTKAAEQLRLAQPSLTRQIANLEAEIGVQLLNRTKHRVTLTEEGRVFLIDAKRILALAFESVEAVQRLSRGETGQLNVGYVPNFNFELLPQTLGSFREVCPQITLNLFEMNPAEQFRALAERKIDLAFVGFRPTAPPKELQWECVCRQEVSVAISSGHPVAKKRSLRLADLRTMFFVGMSETKYPGYRDWLDETCRSASFTPRVLQEADFDAGLLAFVRENLGVALVREQISKRASAGVIFRPLQPRLQTDYWVAWHRNNASAGVQKYIDIIKKAAVNGRGLGVRSQK